MKIPLGIYTVKSCELLTAMQLGYGIISDCYSQWLTLKSSYFYRDTTGEVCMMLQDGSYEFHPCTKDEIINAVERFTNEFFQYYSKITEIDIYRPKTSIKNCIREEFILPDEYMLDDHLMFETGTALFEKSEIIGFHDDFIKLSRALRGEQNDLSGMPLNPFLTEICKNFLEEATKLKNEEKEEILKLDEELDKIKIAYDNKKMETELYYRNKYAGLKNSLQIVELSN